ncbi:MAG: nucleoside hydrolase, partial [Phycisphaerales bacterium]
MENPNRRQVMGMTAAGLAASALGPKRAHASGSERTSRKIPVLHVTDLFRPHMDPDDHWDLACVYALAHRGDIHLKGILIDHPPRGSEERNPDVAAVAQMNLIAGLAVPVAVGSSLPLKSRDDVQNYASPIDHHGVRMVLDLLERSPDPVIINILGSSRDIAIAGKKAPDLFASKCAAIYLNAGTGSPTMNSQSKLEYNVTLDRHAFAAVFDLPCPLYWMPCFEEMETRRERPIREYGTHYKFRQSEILPHLSDMV